MASYTQRQLHRRHAKFQNQLRNRPTRAEKIVMQWLEDKGIRFIFQKGFFTPFHRIVDFYFPKPHRIILEVDGSSHDGKEEKDYRRDVWYENVRGYRIIRIQNYHAYSGIFRTILKYELGFPEHQEQNYRDQRAFSVKVSR